MALTASVLRANQGLANLTDEQVKAIEELSRNDENAVIGARIGELHGQYDQDVLGVTGIQKNQGEKSYDYVKRVLGEFKQKAAGTDALNAQVDGLKKQVEEYKKAIEGGQGNETLARQLKDTRKQLADTQALFEEKEKQWKEKYDGLNGQYQQSLIGAEFDKALQGMKFKGIYPESVRQTLVDAAKKSILADVKPDWVEENGNKKLVFRGKDGNILNNPENRLNPYTPGELLRRELKDVLDTGRQQQGAGTHGGQGSHGGSGGPVGLEGAASQVAADEAIAKYLMGRGLTRGSKEFSDESVKIRKEYGVDKLPLQA